MSVPDQIRDQLPKGSGIIYVAPGGEITVCLADSDVTREDPAQPATWAISLMTFVLDPRNQDVREELVKRICENIAAREREKKIQEN